MMMKTVRKKFEDNDKAYFTFSPFYPVPFSEDFHSSRPYDLMKPREKKDIRRGMVICAPKTITPHTDFKGEVYVLSKEEGGRHTPFFNKYRPQFYFRTTDVTGECELPAGVEMVMPGDNVNLTVKLIAPIAMEKGLKFAIREGGRTVGAGQVTEILK